MMQNFYEAHKRRLQLHKEIMQSLEERKQYYSKLNNTPNK